MSENNLYEIEKFKAFSIAKLTRMVGIPQKRLEELLDILNTDKKWISREEATKIIENGVPLEPFIIGKEQWEKMQVTKDREISSAENEITLLVADSIKEKTKNFKYSLNEEAYRLFLRYRNDFHNKKVSQKGAEKQKGKLRKYPKEIQLAMIKKAIEKRWESIFDLSEAEMSKIAVKNEDSPPLKKLHEEKGHKSANDENVNHLSFEDMMINFENKGKNNAE